MSMNNTLGEIEPLQGYHYTLGGFLLLSFLTISVLNIFLLISFYNLRRFAFVRNANTVISLIVTDLVNALLLTPTMLSWYLMAPPYSYGVCVFKSFPFMLSNFTSLLSMTVFTVHRLTVIKKITVGEFKVRTKHIGMATLVLWLMSILGVSVPYIVWNNSGQLLLDCRRVLFSNIQMSFVYFSVLFDLPFVIMNVTLVSLIIICVKYKAKVNAVPNTDTIGDRNENQNDTSPRFKTCSLGIGLTSEVIDESNRSTESTLADIPIETKVHFKNRVGAVSDLDTVTELTEGNDCNSVDFDGWTNPTTPGMMGKPCVLPEGSNVNSLNETHHVTDVQIQRDVHEVTEKSADNDARRTGQRNGKKMRSQDMRSQTWARTPNPEPFRRDVEDKRDERGILVNDLKQFLITMGVLVVVYDITVLPLLLDITIGGVIPDVIMPHALNSLCFLNSFCNPIVYLIRMKKVRHELKRLVTTCVCIHET